MRAFTCGKVIRKYSNLTLDYALTLKTFESNGFTYNNTLHKKSHMTLIMPKMGWFKRNSVLKFRIVLINTIDNRFDGKVYSDVISKYLIFLFIYFIPFIFTFAIHFDKQLNNNIIILASLVFIILFIPFIIIAMFLQNIFRKRFISKIEKILYFSNIATAPNKA